MSLFSDIKKNNNKWMWSTFLITLFLSLPVIVVFSYLFIPASSAWLHIRSALLGSYTMNTMILMAGVGILVVIIGLTTSWLVTMYRFPGHRFFEWALILPLSLPAYIAAYTYAGMLDYTGTAYTLLRNTFGLEVGQYLFLDVMTMKGAIFVMGLVLYPYVYVICRSYFLQQSASILEISGSLGKSPLRTFFRPGLSLARPAIIGGLTLALMEVLNDYGTVKYFGVDTFTIGIFTAFTSFGDTNAALKLSSILLIVVFIIIILERLQRGRARFDVIGSQFKPVKTLKIHGYKKMLAFSVCAFPFLLGFLLPVIQLILWAFQTAVKVVDLGFVKLILNSFFLALIAALLCIVIALFIAFTARTFKSAFIKTLSKIATLGYTIPGAVIAVGVMIPFTWMDNSINTFFGNYFNLNPGLILSGTLIALIFAYIVRFMAVGFNTVETGFDKVSISMDEASRSLGASPSKTLFNVNIPLLKGTLLSAFLLVFIDILKELPLTLILRPFNFDTLAIKAFEYASDEMIAESSSAALIIVATGIIPVLILNKMISKK